MIETIKEGESIGTLDKIKQSLNDFKKNLTDNLSKPKENSEEYKRLENFLGEELDDYLKYWTTKKVKTSIEMVEKGILSKDNITKKGAYMNKWDSKAIEIAQKLTEIGMEIKPYDCEYIKHWTDKKIENLKKFKAENNNSLEQKSLHPVFGNEYPTKINAYDYDSFK